MREYVCRQYRFDKHCRMGGRRAYVKPGDTEPTESEARVEHESEDWMTTNIAKSVTAH